MPSQIQTRWVYPMVGVTTQKGLPRVTSDTRVAFELTGVDGSLRGGIRPFPGFTKAHTFMSGTGTVDDYTVFELRLDADSAAHGVAYLRGNAVYVDINFPIDGWVTQTVHSTGADGPLDSVSWGKVVYILCRGLPPVAVRGYRANETDTVGVINPAGPGDPPRALWSQIPVVDETAGNAPGEIDSWAEIDTDGDGTPDDRNSDGLGLFRESNPANVVDATVLPAGDYAFAYSFYDSRTGRRSQLSNIVEISSSGDGDAGTDNTGSGYYEWRWHTIAFVPSNDTLGLPFIPLRFSNKWDRIYLWRSVRVEGAGGTYVAAILHLDKIIPFRYQNTQPNTDGGLDTGEQDIKYRYELKDTQLVTQDIRLDRSSLYRTMPRGGTGAILNDVMYIADLVPDPVETTEALENNNDVIVENQNDIYPNEAQQGVGEIRWSQTLDPHPELFHWSGRHMSSTVTERPLRLLTVGEAVVGMSRNRSMVIRRQGGIVLVDEIHEGYGLSNRNACASISDSVWFLSDKGLKKVTVTGVLADVPILDELIVQDWGGTLGGCEMAFDHRAGCLWLLNPAKEKLICLWMESGMLTEFEEVPFEGARTGMWPNEDDIHVRRTLFLKGNSLWMADHDRRESGVRLLKVSGDCLADVEDVTNGVVELSPHSGGSRVAVEVGMWVHSGGKKWRITSATEISNTPNTRVVLEPKVQGDPLPVVGDVLVLSPVVFRWSGGILNGQTEDGQNFLSSSDMFRSRQLSSVGCVFDSVTGTGEFRGCAFFGTTLTPTHYGEFVPIQSVGGLPTDYSAFGTYGVSHSSLSPGVEVLCADLDFRLLSVLCRGRIDASDRAR